MKVAADIASGDLSGFLAGPSENETPRFRLLRRLGGGGEGEVYLCEDSLESTAADPGARRTRWAVKLFVCPSPEAAADLHRRMVRSVVLPLRSLGHPGIVRYHEAVVGPPPSRPAESGSLPRPSLPATVVYLVMDYAEGETLDAWWRQRSAKDLPAAFGLLEQVCAAVDHLHGARPDGLPLVHGDIKPRNVVVSSVEGSWRATLVDLSMLSIGEKAASRGGTLGYMPPDAADRLISTATADNYAVGGLLWFVLTRRHPPTEYDPQAMRAELEQAVRQIGTQEPGPMVELVMSMMTFDARRRPTSASSWFDSLNEATINPDVVGPAASHRRWPRRRSQRIALVTVAAGLAVGAGVVAALPDRPGTVGRQSSLSPPRSGVPTSSDAPDASTSLADGTPLPGSSPAGALDAPGEALGGTGGTPPSDALSGADPDTTPSGPGDRPAPMVAGQLPSALFFDDFSTDKGWPVSQGEFHVEGGLLEGSLPAGPYTGAISVAPADAIAGNVHVAVQANKVTTPVRASIGLVCRYTPERERYGARIFSDGNYIITKVVKGQSAQVNEKFGPVSVRSGWNNLELFCLDDGTGAVNVRFLVNGVLAGAFTDIPGGLDGDPLPGGKVAVELASGGDGLTGRFDNFSVGPT